MRVCVCVCVQMVEAGYQKLFLGEYATAAERFGAAQGMYAHTHIHICIHDEGIHTKNTQTHSLDQGMLVFSPGPSLYPFAISGSCVCVCVCVCVCIAVDELSLEATSGMLEACLCNLTLCVCVCVIFSC